MRFFLKKNKNPKIEEENVKEKDIEEIDFTDQIFTEIVEMKLKIENIKSEVEIYNELKELIKIFEEYIEKIKEVQEEKEIEDKLAKVNETNIILELGENKSSTIPESVINKAKTELEIEEYYKNLKTIYDLKYGRASQKILMEKLEKFNSNIESLLIGNIEGEDKISLNEIETYYNILLQKKEEFNGIMQNKYIEKLIELEYRIGILKMIDSRRFDDDDEIISIFLEKFKGKKARQMISSRLFIESIEMLRNEYISIKEKYKNKDMELSELKIENVLYESNSIKKREREIQELRNKINYTSINEIEEIFKQIEKSLEQEKLNNSQYILNNNIIDNYLDLLKFVTKEKNRVKDLEKIKLLIESQNEEIQKEQEKIELEKRKQQQ